MGIELDLGQSGAGPATDEDLTNGPEEICRSGGSAACVPRAVCQPTDADAAARCVVMGDVAGASGINVTEVSRIGRGRRDPSHLDGASPYRALEVPASRLIDRAG